ncbi:DUF4286 family protein [Capnocytophaga catalasegens]|uniref:DUF4286 domain-containing protein n=1 Tax=Capnocytophaga catalasegens TaxID=1004260 RepID=A0AAV5AY07_9FLAO|nr:DUF4286 family protein [Capnocytophaga catalasegens]GIZ14303.1 hypothetical protein RCZ03_03040 [Capnocytophaga catalasegens]GJM51300.1 hypothetical protein RCZ15_22730 [Capnocytophaga catalasegens]GJM53283.1 hypothetical protein RCZ16_16000 [Capnocytophaga catalasegens]
MFYYNITYTIEKSLQNRWKNWIFNDFIPHVVKKGKFDKARLIWVKTDDAEYNTYSLQLETPDTEIIKEFQEKDENNFLRLLYIQFAEKVLTFSTELHLVETIMQKELNDNE